MKWRNLLGILLYVISEHRSFCSKIHFDRLKAGKMKPNHTQIATIGVVAMAAKSNDKDILRKTFDGLFVDFAWYCFKLFL